MNLLAFETATEACSVAVWLDGEVRERFELAPRRHAELALPWAEELLAQAGIKRGQLDAIAISRGPGAFTGVRLAIAIAQGIALALDKPIVPVSTLAVLALRAHDLRPDGARTEPQRVFAVIDARMGEVYTAAYELRDGDAFALDDEVVIAPTAAVVPGEHNGWFGVGTGFAAAEDALRERLTERFAAIERHLPLLAVCQAFQPPRIELPLQLRDEGERFRS